MNDAEIRAKVDVGDGGGFTRIGNNIKNCNSQAQFLKAKIDDLKIGISQMESMPSKFGKTEIIQSKAELEKLENQYSNLTNVQEVSSNSIEKGMNKGIKSLKRFGLSLFGIQSIWRLVSRASSSYLAQDTETANKISAVWVGLGSFLAPLLDGIADMVIKAVKYLNVFITALTGVDYLAKAITKSMAKMNKTTSAAMKNLSSLDEINNIGGNDTADLSWIDAFNDVTLNQDVVDALTTAGNAIGTLKNAFDGLSGSTKTVLGLFGVAGLIGILTGSPSVFLSIGIVITTIEGLTKIFDEDLTTSLEGMIWLLGTAGLIGILTGNAGVAVSIGLVVLALFGLNEYLNGDTTQALEGIIALLGFGGLAGAFIGGTKGLSVGLAISSVILLFQSFNKLISGDTTDQIKGLIGLITGTSGLVVAINLIRGGAKAGLLGLITPLGIIVVGIVALAAGIYAVVTNWSKMSGLEKVISILGLLAIAAAVAAASVGALQSAWTLGIAAAAIAGGVAAIAYSISAANKSAQENIPALAVGTNYVGSDGLAYLHQGEAVIPKKFNSQEYFSQTGNTDLSSKLDTLIETLENKDMNAYISKKAIGNASTSYKNQQSRIMGW